jgi:hypothetical protein
MPGRDLCEYHELAISVDELYGSSEVEQEVKRLPRHWARQEIAADDDPVYLRSSNIFEYSLERRKISVNVIQRRDSHSTSRSPVVRRTPELSRVAARA